jgi:uncharacterized protein YdhG (YjbR/CyaY superfamily)
LSHPTPYNVAFTHLQSENRTVDLIIDKLNQLAKTMKSIRAKNIDEYIAAFPKDIQKILKEIRATIRKTAPDAEETIKYDMPSFEQNGILVSFAAFKNHIGFYPAPREVEAFKKELAAYEGAKSTLKIPLDSPPPLTLIRKIVKFRVKQLSEKRKAKKIDS